MITFSHQSGGLRRRSSDNSSEHCVLTDYCSPWKYNFGVVQSGKIRIVTIFNRSSYSSVFQQDPDFSIFFQFCSVVSWNSKFHDLTIFLAHNYKLRFLELDSFEFPSLTEISLTASDLSMHPWFAQSHPLSFSQRINCDIMDSYTKF